MAKRKRRKSPPQTTVPSEFAVAVETQSDDSTRQDAETRYLGQWNRLVSTTNWEKGRIICGWRDALMTSGAAVTEYSDEAWSQLVGGVSSQHVGRLRRVFQRFGETFDQYEGLFWSHFQAALDWDDAEMWLEGAIQNEWSVSQMRGQRWETLGTPAEEQQAEVAEDSIDVGSELPFDESPETSKSKAIETPTPISASKTEIKPVDQTTEAERGKPAKKQSEEAEPSGGAHSTSRDVKRKPLQVNVEKLPDDLAEAFEAFKLAIIAHRTEGWNEATPEMIFECLDALRELTLAETD